MKLNLRDLTLFLVPSCGKGHIIRTTFSKAEVRCYREVSNQTPAFFEP